MIDEPQPMNSMFPQDEPEDSGDDFDIEENEDGSATIVPKKDDSEEINLEFYDNLVSLLDATERMDIANEYLGYVEIDKLARSKRDQQYEDGLRRSGLGHDAPGGADFEGASRVVHPMITKMCVDFESRVIKEIFPPGDAGPYDLNLKGKYNQDKFERAQRKKEFINKQLSEDICEYRLELEKMLTQVPLGGCQYMKWGWNLTYEQVEPEFVPIDYLYIPYNAKSVYSATRVTHQQDIGEVEFEQRVASELYDDDEIDVDAINARPDQTAAEKANDKIEGKEADAYNEDGLRRVYEIHCMMKLDQDKESGGEYAPYVLVIDEPTSKILALRRNWEEADKTKRRMQWFIEWPFIYWRGAYAIGVFHLIGAMSAAATGALRALMDSAHINNAATLIKLKGGRFTGQTQNISVTQVNELDAGAGSTIDDIRKIAMPLPFNPPSPVLFELLGFLDQKGDTIVRMALDNLVDMGGQQPVGTTLALIEQGLAVFSAIYARLYDAQIKTLQVLERLYRMYLPEEVKDDEGEVLVYRKDFSGKALDLRPIGDPRIFSNTQKLLQIQGIVQRSDAAPGLYNKVALERRYLQMMNIQGVDEILPDPQKPPDTDPVTENIKMAMGQPVVALPDQDHMAHIQVHMDFISSELYGKNPMLMPRLLPIEIQHILQHIIYEYGSDALALIGEAAGTKAEDLLDHSEEVMKHLSQAFAAGSTHLIQMESKKFTNVVQILNQLSQQMQQMQQGQQQSDPALQLAKTQADATMLTAQSRSEESKANAQNEQQKLGLEAQKNQIDAENAQLKAKTEITKNLQDNETALQISSERLMSGHSVGNFKNGNSL